MGEEDWDARREGSVNFSMEKIYKKFLIAIASMKTHNRNTFIITVNSKNY